MRKPPPPPIYFLGAIGCMAAFHYLLPITHWLTWPSRALGVVVILFGFELAAYAHGQFRRANTTVMPFAVSSALVTDGLFSLTRNPMYLGMVFVLIGVWVCLGTLSPLVILPLFVWLMTRFIRVEEASLKEQFGKAYENYCESVRRWV